VTGKTKDDEVGQLEADASRTHGEAEARQP
jgi:hypothetical protein